jgi:hypothetical protein
MFCPLQIRDGARCWLKMEVIDSRGWAVTGSNSIFRCSSVRPSVQMPTFWLLSHFPSVPAGKCQNRAIEYFRTAYFFSIPNPLFSYPPTRRFFCNITSFRPVCSIRLGDHTPFIHYASGSQTFSVHGALGVSGFFHGAQSQNIGLSNSCIAQLVRLGWLS